MSMREASLRLHARKSSMEVLARLDHKARDDFNGELLWCDSTNGYRLVSALPG